MVYPHQKGPSFSRSRLRPLFWILSSDCNVCSQVHGVLSSWRWMRRRSIKQEQKWNNELSRRLLSSNFQGTAGSGAVPKPSEAIHDVLSRGRRSVPQAQLSCCFLCSLFHSSCTPTEATDGRRPSSFKTNIEFNPSKKRCSRQDHQGFPHTVSYFIEPLTKISGICSLSSTKVTSVRLISESIRTSPKKNKSRWF